MRNIYYVELGNYNGNEVVDKKILPVSAKSLSITDADTKLSSVMSTMGVNCVVSIREGIVLDEFTEMYDLEAEKFVPYDVNFMLITCIEREIDTENFATFAEAREHMIHAVLDNMNDEDVTNEYYEFHKENGNYDGDDFGISTTSAWANADYGDKNCDWSIIVC